MAIKLPKYVADYPRATSKSLSGGFWLSFVLHVGVLFLVFGDFDFWRSADEAEEVVIEVVILPDAKEGEVEQIARRDPIPPPPPPPPREPQPEPEPEPIPDPEADAIPPEPPEPQEAEAVPPSPSPPEEVPNAEEFSQSILKTLEELQPQTPEGEDEETVQKPLSGIAQNIPEANQATVGEAALSGEETQALRRALAECWSIAGGARDVANMRVDVRISLRRDGSLIGAEVLERQRMRSDAAYRAVAEDALRALYHPKCRRLPLPPEKYESWKTIIFEFDPQKMIG